jgi:hypothetical protein
MKRIKGTHMARTWIGWTFLTALVAASAVVAAEGTHGGNGGVVMVCRKGGDPGTVQPIERIELLDVYQANSLKLEGGLEIPITRKNTPFRERIDQVLKLLQEEVSEEFATDLRWEYERAWEYKMPLREPPAIPARKRLSLTGDFTNIAFESGCHPEQLANYREDFLLYDPELYRALEASPTDLAGFWLHEPIYKIMRMRKYSRSSDETRELVAQLLADNPDTQRVHEIVESARWKGQGVIWVDPYHPPRSVRVELELLPDQSGNNAAPWRGVCALRGVGARDWPNPRIIAAAPVSTGSPRVELKLPTLPQQLKYTRIATLCGTEEEVMTQQQNHYPHRAQLLVDDVVVATKPEPHVTARPVDFQIQ